MKYLRTITGLALTPALCFSQEINEIIEVNAQQSGSEWRMTPGSVDLIDINQQLPSLNIDAGDTLRAIPGIQADTRYNYAQDTRWQDPGKAASTYEKNKPKNRKWT